MQGLMVAPVLVLDDGRALNLAPPSENKRWNEANRAGYRRDENRYTHHEVIALHVQTGDKVGVINAIDKSTYLPNARNLNNSNEHKSRSWEGEENQLEMYKSEQTISIAHDQ